MRQAFLPLLGLWATAALARHGQAGALLQKLHGLRLVDPNLGLQNEAPADEKVFTRAETEPRFLNECTAEYAVNGTSIPDVDFDVGESYAGQLPISDKEDEMDKLFFWFFPTANKEQLDKKEIVIWLNGGPGCSSLLGFLQENGPFQWFPGTLKPKKNPWSWHLLTNVVWIEQPVTVGFSQGQARIKNEDDLAEQFLGFWKNFMRLFGMQGWKVYVVAESYGGYYGPYISSHMVDSKDDVYFNLGGLMIYDGLMFDGAVQSNVVLESFVEQHYELTPLDDTTMSNLHTTSAACGFTDYHKKYLVYPPAGPAPQSPPWVTVLENGTAVSRPECENMFSPVWDAMRLANPCFNIYNIADHCPAVYNPLGRTNPYFDRQDVKKAINAPADVKWSQCVDGVFNTTGGFDGSAPPDKYELPNVIDKTGNVILAHGSMDLILPLNGVLLGVQNMTWGGRLGFQEAPSEPFYVPLYGFLHGTDYYGNELPASSGVVGTTHTERGLTLVVTQLAGHEGPGYSAASALRHLEKLLGRVDSLSEATPFTLPQLRKIAQPQQSLGNGVVKIPCLGRGC